MAGHIATAARVDWCTPPGIYQPIVDFFGQIDLDPCTNNHSCVPATRKVMLPEDGLSVPWDGNVYCNPPYGRGLRKWVDKAASSQSVIMLLPAAVGTKHWQEVIFRTAQAVCFIKGRVKFVGATASAPMDCALVYWGTKRGDVFKAQFASVGKVVTL
jgi:hypothetical protein